MIRSYFAITYFSAEKHESFSWNEEGPFYEGLDSTPVVRCHGIVAFTVLEDIQRNTTWTILVMNTTGHTVETPILRPKSINGIQEYITLIGTEIGQARWKMSLFSDKVWRTVKLPVCEPIYLYFRNSHTISRPLKTAFTKHIADKEIIIARLHI